MILAPTVAEMQKPCQFRRRRLTIVRWSGSCFSTGLQSNRAVIQDTGPPQTSPAFSDMLIEASLTCLM